MNIRSLHNMAAAVVQDLIDSTGRNKTISISDYYRTLYYILGVRDSTMLLATKEHPEVQETYNRLCDLVQGLDMYRITIYKHMGARQ